MPKRDESILKFTGYAKQLRIPDLIYTDFESLHMPEEVTAGKKRTRLLAKQIPCSYCYIIVRCDGQTKAPVLYRGEGAVEHFLKALETELEEIIEEKTSRNGKFTYHTFKNQAALNMTQDNWNAFNKAKECFHCSGA